MQLFLAQINFVRHVVPDFAQKVLPLQSMIKKNVKFKWNALERRAFNTIK